MGITTQYKQYSHIYYVEYCYKVEWWLALLPHSKKILGSIWLQPFCVDFECSCCVCMGSLCVLQLPTAQRHA